MANRRHGCSAHLHRPPIAAPGPVRPDDPARDGFERTGTHPIGIGRLVKPHELYLDHVIHELDVRRPLGLPTEWTADQLRAALDALTVCRSPLFNSARRVRGRRLIATDVDWTWGDRVDPVIQDTAENILLAIGGRRTA